MRDHGSGRKTSVHRSYENVMLIQRVLSVLEHFNRSQVSTVGRISSACDIPPSSVVRILETLCVEGYLTHISRRGGYAVTSKVRSLSSGFHGSLWLAELLSPLVDDLTRRFLWPFSMATLDRDAMVVQYSTIPLSPLAHVKTTLHKRLSLVSRAHGRAYIAFCTSQERRHLLRLAIAAQHPENEVIATAQDWRQMITQTRRRGYGLRCSAVDPATSTIAVPIELTPGHVVATLGMTFFRRAVNDGKIAAYASALKEAAAVAAHSVEEEIASKTQRVQSQPDEGAEAAAVNRAPRSRLPAGLPAVVHAAE
jgi:IclR family mhp operon transcriptional activator